MDKLNKWLSKFQQKTTLTPIEKYSIRLGYMGTGMLMVAPHLLPSETGVILYIVSGVLLLPQVLVAKQWNLVLINANMILAYLIMLK